MCKSQKQHFPVLCFCEHSKKKDLNETIYEINNLRYKSLCIATLKIIIFTHVISISQTLLGYSLHWDKRVMTDEL
jgi:hypothetical protein